MDFLTQQFIAISKRLLNEISGLRDSIDALRDQEERHYQEHKTEQRTEQQPAVRVNGEINAEVHETETAQRENRSRHNRNLWVQVAIAVGTWLAFAAAAIYAGITLRTLNEFKKQTPAIQQAADTAANTLKNAQKTFEADERPYLVGDKHPIFAGRGLAPNVRLEANLTFRNIGKAPAEKEVTNIELLRYVIPKGVDKKKLTARDFLDKAFSELRKKDSVTREKLKSIESGNDLAPGDEFFDTNPNDIVLSVEEYRSLISDDPNIILFYISLSTYTDAFGNFYETDFCRFFWGTHQEIWHRCGIYNTIR